ncbi:MAG: threonylcarbamoyl-AMP synthase [Candidatus Pelagibacter sp.]|nr:threonylcarbamoyl-AMP synthase [Candidatus Pelagibacter sp.]|tara:strand:- start:864 stop:1808 length:945 start_codon:yes stop_codon:yes gene_type:complete
MKNIYKNSRQNLNKAKKFLKNHNLIAVPTETVYGLAGNAYSNISVRKIYKLKKRPKRNPLIIHYYNLRSLKKDAFINKNFLKLYKKFSPGPLTYILKKRKNSKISLIANSGLKTIAIRFPKNKIIRNLLKNLEFPLAIPSANISSALSPVSSSDVLDEFSSKIKFILDGGTSKIGLESTVINLYGKTQILRPGSINIDQIGKVLKKKLSFLKKTNKISSPGLLKKHYSPGIPIKLNCKKADNKAAFIVFGKKYKDNNKNIFNLSKRGNLEEAARNLYKTLRKIKNLGFKKINIVRIPNNKIGIAINDRLRKAAY